MTVSARRHGQKELVERLRAHREEIEQTLLTRVYAVSDPREVGDPEYALGLRTAVTAALEYALDSMGTSEAHRPPMPPELTAQAKAAARAGVSLDTVLRRYFAGYTLLSHCLVREARQGNADLAEAMRSQADLFDRLIAAVTEAHTAEAKDRLRTTERRRAERVKQLLRGDPVEVSELGYDLDPWHLGIVAMGPGVTRALRELAAELEYRLLLVQPGGKCIWAWLGSRRKATPRDAAGRLAAHGAEMLISIGEPGRGMTGWRLTHQQAQAALPVALRGKERIVNYSNVAVLSSVLRDDTLTGSLRELYLVPLEEERDGGIALFDTLRAYFSSGRNVVSAAAVLGISRQTVSSRLQAIEGRIGRSIDSCGADIDTALRLRELDHLSSGAGATNN